jgi:multiple sugar transport system permease protein
MTTAMRIRPAMGMRQRDLVNKVLVTGLGLFIVLLFIAPLIYMLVTGMKSYDQMGDFQVPAIWPFSRSTFTYQGNPLDLYKVPTSQGTKLLAMYKPGRTQSLFIDPQNPDAGPITWAGNWRLLAPLYHSDPQWHNFVQAWNELNFPLLIRNTLIIALTGTLGAVVSAILVAYGFARFFFRGKDLLFIILIGTIVLPVQATLIPTYVLYSKIHWTNTFLPLIVPNFFANAYNVFLLRMYFMQLPRELDEAAMMDGANPFQILWYVVLPQSVPAVTAVCLFHFFFAWNDFFQPLVYLASNSKLWPISVGLQYYNAMHGRLPNLIQTGALIAIIFPVVIFFLAQRVFMQGIVFTGIEK